MKEDEKLFYDKLVSEIEYTYRRSNFFELSQLKVEYSKNKVWICKAGTSHYVIFYEASVLKVFDLDTKTAARIMAKALNKVRLGIGIG